MNSIDFIYNVFFNITRLDGSLNGLACVMYAILLMLVITAAVESNY